MAIKDDVAEALRRNLRWFAQSGIMVPADGTWGVAERIALTDNSSIEKMITSFPAWTPCEGHFIIEQRRPDCNFETALMYLLAAESLGDPTYRKIAENILDFLYHRSGMLNRFDGKRPIGAWKWAHIQWDPTLWFDDHGWNCIIQFQIAERYPELDEKYGMRDWALRLSAAMLDGFNTIFQSPHPDNPEVWHNAEGVWHGDLQLPHWGALVAMTFARAFSETGEAKYRSASNAYFEYIWEERDRFIVSEDAYALIGSVLAGTYIDTPLYADLATFFADRIISKMDPESGNIPAEHGEAPKGTHLVDLIYTINWALLGMHMMSQSSSDAKYTTAFERMLALVLRIQDRSPELEYQGCWRGMYDTKSEGWGGGDCYEGGAGSIYSGWTNAPISWVLAGVLSDRMVLNDSPAKR